MFESNALLLHPSIVALVALGDREGWSSALRSKVQPRSGMLTPWGAVAGIPSAARSRRTAPSGNVSGRPNIASNQPKQGLCQVDKLRGYGVAREYIDAVIEIARHNRDEAAQDLDVLFYAAYTECMTPVKPVIRPDSFANIAVKAASGACCTPNASGKSCC